MSDTVLDFGAVVANNTNKVPSQMEQSAGEIGSWAKKNIKWKGDKYSKKEQSRVRNAS